VLKWVTTKVEEEYSVVSFNDIDILPEGETEYHLGDTA